MKHQGLAFKKVSEDRVIFSLRDDDGICTCLLRYALWSSDLLFGDPRWRERTCLYRYFDASGGLLYAGVSCDFFRRDSQHAGKDWWFDADHVTLELFPSRRMAELAEETAINLENPQFNVRRRPHHAFDIPVDRWFFAAQGERLVGCRPVRFDFKGFNDDYSNDDYHRIVGLTLYDCPFPRPPHPAETGPHEAFPC